MKMRKKPGRCRSLPPNAAVPGKFSTTFRLCFLLIASISLQQGQLLAQAADTTLVKTGYDSIPNKWVQLPYYALPSHLTATSTDVVYNKNLVKSPVTNVLNALTGRLAGIYTEQFSGQPGSDGVSLSLHGRSPIVLIDGVARNLTTLDLEEIESVTILKDAVSTAMLGVRGANGAIQITTRKGIPGRQIISFTAQTAIQQPLSMPKTLGAYDYASLRNEAIDNDLRANPSLANSLASLRFTDAALQGYLAGSDTFNYPNVDWQSQLLKKTSTFNRYSLNASGGNNFTRFFVALEHFNQQGLFKEDPVNNYRTNNILKGFLARTNVEINITPKLTGGIALLGRIINGNEPAGVVSGTNTSGGTGSIFSAILATPNNAYPIYNRDGSFGSNQNYTQPNFTNTALAQASNLQAITSGSGYLQNYRRDILADFFLKRTLDEILPGLWIKGRLSYSSFLTENFTRIKGFVAYRYNGTALTPVGLKIDQINTNGIGSQGRSNYAEVSAGYNHIFKQNHGVDVLLMANSDAAFSGSDLPYTISGTSGSISYNYKQKYVLEGAYAYNGSNRYPGGVKRGFFPSLGIAWNIDRENFASHASWLSNLKLYASYGKMGWDNPGYFSYLQRYPGFTQPIFGTSATGQASVIQGTLANTDITWEKANKANVGIEGSILNHKLGFRIDYYNNKFYDLLIQRGRNTALLGVAYPNENIGINRYKGIDFQLSWQQKINKFNYFIAANASVQNSEVIYSDEVNQPFDYLRRTGQTVGRPFGYVAEGIFQSVAEIAASAKFRNNILTQPGDIKYKDLNNDGEINQLDITAIGTNKPLTVYGLTLGFNCKSFDFSALLQGVANRNIFLTGNRFYEFQNGGLGQAYKEQLDRWTPTNTGASYPRLSIGNANSNNREFSSYWVRSGNYVRLKNVELGYTLPVSVLKRIKISTLRIFVNGLNLLTSSVLDGIDPEVYNGSYPIQRLFNFGINIKF